MERALPVVCSVKSLHGKCPSPGWYHWVWYMIIVLVIIYAIWYWKNRISKTLAKRLSHLWVWVKFELLELIQWFIPLVWPATLQKPMPFSTFRTIVELKLERSRRSTDNCRVDLGARSPTQLRPVSELPYAVTCHCQSCPFCALDAYVFGKTTARPEQRAYRYPRARLGSKVG